MSTVLEEPSTTYQWLTVKEAAERAKVGTGMIYLAIKQGRLRASRLGVRKDFRILESWVDAWISSASEPTLVNPNAPGVDAPTGRPIPFNRHGRKKS
jgi:excisionase family DNA binding protein